MAPHVRFLSRDILRLVVAVFFGYSVAVALFFGLNTALDSRLRAKPLPLTEVNKLTGVSEQKIASILLYGPGQEATASWIGADPKWWLPFFNDPVPTLQRLILAVGKCQAEGPACEKRRQEISVAVGPALTQLRDSNEYLVRRYLNGPIQFFTIVFAFAGLVLLLWATWDALGEYRALHAVEQRLVFDRGIWAFDGATKKDADRVLVNDRREAPLFDKEQAEGLSSLLRDGPLRKLYSSSAVTVTLAVCNAYTSSSLVQEARRTLESETSALKEKLDARHAMLRYFIWAVPSLGFIGTVVGIGKALDNAHTVLTSPDAEAYVQSGAIQFITANLGVAFDTTLVALLASLVMMLFTALVTRFEEVWVEHLSESVSRLVARMKGTPLETLFSQVLKEKSVVKIEMADDRFRKVLREWSGEQALVLAKHVEATEEEK